MNGTLEVNSDLKAQLQDIAEQTHRSATELANEALQAFIAHDHYIRDKIQRGLQQADAGEFASEDEVERFFAQQ